MVRQGMQLKYFVLNPSKNDDYGAASRAAMMAYAEAIAPVNLKFSNDILRMVRNAQKAIADRQ